VKVKWRDDFVHGPTWLSACCSSITYRFTVVGFTYEVEEAHEKKKKPKTYSDNYNVKFYGIPKVPTPTK